MLQLTIRDEIKISSHDMDCNYQSEDLWRSKFNFESPKLILTDTGYPLVSFVDLNSNSLVFTEISNGNAKNLLSMPIQDKDKLRGWPIIFTKENNIYLSFFSKSTPETKYEVINEIKVFQFDNKTFKMQLKDDRLLKVGGLWGIYPYYDKFMLIGINDYICLRQVPLYLLSAHLPIYFHNASYILDSAKEPERQLIEEQGCHSVSNQNYEVSTTGIIHAAWIRYTHGNEHDEAVYYNSNKDGKKWARPIELYSVKDTKVYNYIINLSLANTYNSAIILWQDRVKGIFFTEIRDDKIIETTKISDIKKIDIFEEPLRLASTLKITSDKYGNAYALWAQNTGRDYQLFFKARINGKWMDEIVINRGSGYIKLPDIKVNRTLFTRHSKAV